MLQTYDRNKRPKVMIIDDDIGLLRLLGTVLRNLQLEPILASSAMEAYTIINEGCCPDLILLDIRMPGISGFEAFKYFRTLPELNPVKIIALTAYADAKLCEEIITCGFDDYISKPFKKTDFAKSVMEALISSRRLLSTESG
jgi:CheY-like chemotaxis protein